MSWRDILKGGSSKDPLPEQNSQNLQKSPAEIASAVSANIAQEEPDPPGGQLRKVLQPICNRYPVTAVEVIDNLDEEDINDWKCGRIGTEALDAFARSLVHQRMMARGQCPDHYFAIASCRQCGPVWSWRPGQLEACPWCRNRLSGRPIPRPVAELEEY